MIYRFFASQYGWGPERVSQMTPIQMDMYLTADVNSMVDPNNVGYTVGRGSGPSVSNSGNLVFDNLEEAQEWQSKHQQA